MGEAIVIAAQSGRALAQAARRAGLRPYVADLFGDEDTCALAEATAIMPGRFGRGMVPEAALGAMTQLDAQQQADIDCIVVDVKMPGLSGIELQSELNRRGEHAPMIFVTSYEDDRTRNAALSGGALAFLRKPVNIGKLMGCLESVLGPQP